MLQEVTSTSEPILFLTSVAACTIFVFMNVFLQNIGQQLINLNSVFTTLLVEWNALKKQKRPCKTGGNVYMGKKRPTKARSPFFESEILVRRENLFSYKQILIFQ